MADVSTAVPIIGPYLGWFGVGGAKYNPVDVTVRGKTQTVRPTIRGPKIVPIRPVMEVPRSVIGDQVNQAVYDGLAGWVEDYQVNAGLTNVGPHPPAEVDPLPDPIMDPVPLPNPSSPPFINLPVDLPEITVTPPAAVPSVPVEPAPLEDPLEEIRPWNPPYPYGSPTVSPGPRPGSTPATRSAPRSNPVPLGSPFPALLPAVGLGSLIAGALAPGVARNPSALSNLGTRAAPRAQPSAPPRAPPTIQPGLPVDFLTPINPQVPISPNPLNFSVLSAQPQAQPQQQTDKCKCEKPKKKEEKKERPPRAKCFRGTFRQYAHGISYSRSQEIPCEPGAPKLTKPLKSLKASAKGKLTGSKSRAIAAGTKYLKRGKAPKLGELARDVLGF